MNTSDKLGAGLGLSDSPAVLLANVADGLPALLVVEQLDAVSTSSGRMGDNFEAVDEVLHELARVPNVRILLVVRTVDLEGDPRLRRLVAGPGRVERHTMKLLDAGEVTAYLTAAEMSVLRRCRTSGLVVAGNATTMT